MVPFLFLDGRFPYRSEPRSMVLLYFLTSKNNNKYKKRQTSWNPKQFSLKLLKLSHVSAFESSCKHLGENETHSRILFLSPTRLFLCGGVRSPEQMIVTIINLTVIFSVHQCIGGSVNLLVSTGRSRLWFWFQKLKMFGSNESLQV